MQIMVNLLSLLSFNFSYFSSLIMTKHTLIDWMVVSHLLMLIAQTCINFQGFKLFHITRFLWTQEIVCLYLQSKLFYHSLFKKLVNLPCNLVKMYMYRANKDPHLMLLLIFTSFTEIITPTFSKHLKLKNKPQGLPKE